MDIIPATSLKSFTSETNFSNYLLIVDVYSKIPKLYGMVRIATEEVVYKLDMFQSKFGKIDVFGWWDLEIMSADAGTQIYFHRLTGRMSNLQCPYDVSSSGA